MITSNKCGFENRLKIPPLFLKINTFFSMTWCLIRKHEKVMIFLLKTLIFQIFLQILIFLTNKIFIFLQST